MHSEFGDQTEQSGRKAPAKECTMLTGSTNFTVISGNALSMYLDATITPIILTFSCLTEQMRRQQIGAHALAAALGTDAR